ncbi:abcB1 [Symbiodinium natans]|uniref:AbcB1 protein n=1 Tax=Symbiodinium natans TaxID=878477 RepID=A0A812PYI3_9DINO|nr:abcB1 [Symbiodinium natans]
MYATHPQLALIARRTGKTVGHYGVVQNHAMAKANAVAVEVLGSIRTAEAQEVQSNVGEEQEAVFFTQRLNRYLRIIKATVYLETVLRFTQYGLSKVRNIVVLAVAMHQVITGSLTIGAISFVVSVALESMLVTGVVRWQDGFKNLADIWINFKQTITSTGIQSIRVTLRAFVHDMTMCQEGGIQPAYCRGSLSLEDIIALVGESGFPVINTALPLIYRGSGSLPMQIWQLSMRLFAELEDPTAGSIALDGLDYRSYNIRWLRSQIGFVEQEPVLFDRSLNDNIAYGSAKGARKADIEGAAQRANAHTFITALQSGYETHPGERAARISGGQKQRVAIARAIIRSPKMLVLDEATSALDSENEHIVQQALDELMQGKTTFIIAHRLSTVVRSTKILVLDKGRVIEQGTHDELVSDESSRYASFMSHQIVSPLLS